MKSQTDKIAITLVAILASINVANATDNDEKCIASSGDSCLKAKDLIGRLDLETPSTPLFTLLGMSPENVIIPKTGADLAFSLLPHAVDALDGDSMSVAAEINPGFLLLDDRVSLTELHEGDLRTERFLSHFNISLAASNSSGNDGFSRYGLGLSYIYDAKQPLSNHKDYRACVNKHMSTTSEFEAALEKRASVWNDALRDKVKNESATFNTLSKLADENKLTENDVKKRSRKK